MATKRYTIDQNNRKLFIGSVVQYKNNFFLVEDIDYLSWNINQYLTLVDQKNKNKVLKFIYPKEVRVVKR